MKGLKFLINESSNVVAIYDGLSGSNIIQLGKIKCSGSQDSTYITYLKCLKCDSLLCSGDINSRVNICGITKVYPSYVMKGYIILTSIRPEKNAGAGLYLISYIRNMKEIE